MPYRVGLKASKFLVRSLLVVLSAVSLGSRAAGAASNEQTVKAADLRVMTFNIRYGTADDGENDWDQRKDLAIDVLRRHHPDLVGLQEALRFQIDDIRAALAEYGEIGVGRDDGQTRGEYSAILYRQDRFDVSESGTFWLSDTPTVPGSTSWGNQITRICTWGRFTQKSSGRAFYLFNTHLDHVSQLSREKGVILIVERIQKRRHPDPFLVTGDLNAGEDNPAVQYLTGRGELDVAWNGLSKNPMPLVDTFRVLRPDDAEVGTFHSFKGTTSNPKIDYIFARPGTRVLQAAILRDDRDGRYPSDHFPVSAVLRLAGRIDN
jgi:endonuclease/exonuclease/phosphatase family metal-dependent hydrolase